MLKIKDNVDLKELEKFGYMEWDKEEAIICYFKFVTINQMIIEIHKNRIIDFQLPLGSIIRREDIKLETFIDDLIKADLVEKAEDK